MSERRPESGDHRPDVRPGRLDEEQIERNFSDMHPPLSRSEALVESDRCYFCYDAPCTIACPTDIDIPGFIQALRSGNRTGAARTILSQNIMGGMCARVCPTEVLCEEVCVRNTHEDKPVEIGLLQRYATDPVYDSEQSMFERGPQTGKKVAVVGGGPAGLSCAHRLACLGHDVVIFSRDDLLGGLNEYGIAAYKTVDNFAQREVDWILQTGGIEVRTGISLGEDVALTELREQFDAVFLGIGLASTNRLGIPGDDLIGVVDAVDYIALLRQVKRKSQMPVGRRVVVIGGGMTAIDIAVQSARLGAEDVTIVYRRGPEQMNASAYEQAFAQTNGVLIRHYAQPLRIIGDEHVSEIEFERTTVGDDGRLTGTEETFRLAADTVFRAIGQKMPWDRLGELGDALATKHGRIVVDDARQTSLPDVWAGGDCVAGGDDLTVTAVQDGKLAARDIDRYLGGHRPAAVASREGAR